jgi:hypothetical protein
MPMEDTRLLLEGDTLRIGFHGTGKAPHPEDIAPAAVLRALAQHLGVDLQTQGIFWGDYCYFAGITGEAFRFLEFMNLGQAPAGASIAELRTSGSQTDPLGLVAIERWAAHLERDADFAGFTDAQWQKAQAEHGGTAGDLAERRALAASFLELAARALPAVGTDLEGAQAAFQGAHDTVYEVWEAVAKSGPFDPDLARFRDPAHRRILAGLVRRLADLDRRGLRFLERALCSITASAPGPAVPADAWLDGTVRLPKAEPPAAAAAPLWAPENIAIANAMGMLGAFLGESFGPLNEAERANPKLDYVLWMGVSGAAFGLLNDGPERANLPLAFAALGYDYELWMSGQLAQQTGLPCRLWGWDDNLRRRIFWNLRDRRLPVLLFNWGTWPDWWLLTQAEHWGAFRGYGGSSGEGYRPNEPLDHPRNPLRPIRFFEGMKGQQTWTINLTAKRSAPKATLEELYRRAVAWGAGSLGRSEMTLPNASGGTFTSTRPFQDWAAMLRTAALFPADDPVALKQRREQLEGHEVELAERRHYGAAFLDLAAIRLGRPELRTVAGHFRATYRWVEQIWALTGGLGAAEGHLRYAEAAVREAIASLLLEIEREERAAAARLCG